MEAGPFLCTGFHYKLKTTTNPSASEPARDEAVSCNISVD